MQFTAPISQGNSGGPLLNATGKVIGIITSTYVYGEDLNLATYIEELQHIDRTYERSVLEFFEDTQYYQIKMTEELHNEAEPNDTAATANATDHGYTVYGAISGQNVDAFTFTVTGEESVMLTLAFLTDTQNAAFPTLSGALCGEPRLEWEIEVQESGLILCYTNIELAVDSYLVSVMGASIFANGEYLLYTYWRPISEVEAFAYDVPPTDFLP